MGTHVLPKVPGAQLLVQIAVPGLEERARCMPPLRSRELTPGKCPAAQGALLTHVGLLPAALPHPVCPPGLAPASAPQCVGCMSGCTAFQAQPQRGLRKPVC